MVSKEELKRMFSKEWKKHYKLRALEERGFKRQRCKSCGRHFWAVEERDFCGDPACIGYQFIGSPKAERPLGYVETWKRIEDYFVRNGHESIKPYPTVARWRDDLYFTIASINNFQPYVVRGELEPIANPLIVPQPCIRFNDIANVGVTGRHYTNFVMIGQHAFNTERTGLFYWKEEAVEHDINYLKELGIPLEEIVFHEDVWAGGGNFGPSMEYFVGGLELGNVVFMQYEETETGYRELKTKVIDMGAGLSRLAWITHGSPTSYEIVFGEAALYLKKQLDVDLDEELYLEYAKRAGSLNVDEQDVDALRAKIAEELKLSEGFFRELEKLTAAYAIADHSLTLLFTIRDGMMPSNSGGGYNLRLIARRMFAFQDAHGLEIDWLKLLNLHMDHLKGFLDYYRDAVDTVAEVIEHERKKYEESKAKARQKVERLLERGKGIDEETLIRLYKSDGIPPEMVKEYAERKGIPVKIPGDFYEKVREKDVRRREKKAKVDVSHLPATEKLYYRYPVLEAFEAEVLDVIGDWVVLDRTFFYPEGGGQAGDTGYLNDVRVLDTQKEGNVVLHKVENGRAFKKGMKVTGRVDLERRWAIAKNHTATHLVTAAARRVLGKHVWQAGAKKEAEKAHIDLTHYKRITKEELRAIEELVNKWIEKALPVRVREMERNKAEQRYGFTIYQGGAVPGKVLRIVEIGDVDAEACGGTHHMHESTASIGFFKILSRQSVKDGVERITFTTSANALREVWGLEDLLEEASKALSVPKEELPKTARRFFEEWKALKKDLSALEEQLLHLLVEREGIHLLEVEKLPKPKAVEGRGTVVLYSNGRIVVMGRNAESIGRVIVEKLGGKGGGKGFFAGSVEGSFEDVKRVVEGLE